MSRRRDKVTFLGGTRASRGRRPLVVYRAHYREYLYACPGRRWRLTWGPWDGYWVESWARIVNGQVASFGFFDKKELTMKRPDPRRNMGGSGPVHLAGVESEVLRILPQVVAHLTHIRWDDGQPRQPGTVTLRTRGAMWVAEARDFDSAARLVVTASTVDDVLVLLDQMLGSDDAPWEPDRFLEPKSPPKKGK